jgi:elongation factor 1-alpha
MTDHLELSLVLLGAEQTGKSTLVECLVQGESAAQKKLDAAASGVDSVSASQKHASILQHLRDELEKGKDDIDASLSSIKSSRCCFTIVNVPGHKLFLRELLSGGARADVALLILDAVHGCFERSISSSALTKAHASLAFTLGIKKLVIAVTKMDDDSVRFSEQRFQEIREETSRHLEGIGYAAQRVPFVPISGLKGHNVTIKKEEMSWYTGPTLFETLDDVGKAPVTCLSKRPVRMPIQEVHTIGGVGTVVTGCIETGTLRVDQSISVAPGDLSAKIMDIEVAGKQVDQVNPGSLATFSLGDSLSSKDLKSGMVVSDATNDTARDCVSFTAQLCVLSHPEPLRPDMELMINCHVANIRCTLAEILMRMDPKTGKTLETNPSQLHFENAALVRLTPLEPVCVEAFNEYRGLGRFALRGAGVTLAVGIIKEVLKRRPPPVSVPAE